MNGLRAGILLIAQLVWVACDGSEGADVGASSIDAPGDATEREDVPDGDLRSETVREDAAAEADEAAQSDAAAASKDAAASDDAGDERSAAEPKPTLAELMQSYRSWSPHPDEPQAISVQIASLCRLPSAAEQAFTESEHGGERLLQDWLNEQAKRGFETQRVPFELGAAIVKEKLVIESNGERRLVARGLMIKRAAGFDSRHGDWEFGYWEPSTGLRAGSETADYCGRCHASATDFVYLDQSWRLPR